MTVQHEIRFPATAAGFEEAARQLGVILDARQPGRTFRYKVELVFDEIVGNIVRHAQATSDVIVGLSLGDGAVLTFEDDGVPFNPVEQPARPAPESLDEARPGGLGLVLVRKVSSRIEYARTAAGRNTLTVHVAPG